MLKQIDKSIRISFSFSEVKIFTIKAISKNLNLPNLTRFFSFNCLPLLQSKLRFNNKCLLAIKSKVVNRSFRLSRMAFLNVIKFGFIFGLKKASW